MTEPRGAMPSDSLRFFRAAFGALMFVAVLRHFAHGWIEEYYLRPTSYFPWPGLDWVRPWPGLGMYLHYAVMGLAALGIAFGVRLRLSALVFFVTFTYAHLIDRTNYLNHYVLVSLLALLLAAIPLDRRDPRTIPAVALWAVRLQLGLVYLFGGVAKLQPDWLLRAEPLASWLPRNADFPVLGPYFLEPWMAFAMSWAGAAFDLLIVPALSWHRTRGVAYALVLGFHLTTARLFHIGMFPWIMMASTLVFFEPDWPRRAGAWIRGRAPVAAPHAPLVRSSSLAWTALALWIGAQAAFALRGPRDAGWSEEGFRFAWRVMVMEKNGALTMIVRDPDDGREWRVLPSERLTPLQARMVATQPDMILSFAHQLDVEHRARGVRDPEVRADAMVSMNGRPARRLMDPDVDLSAIDDAGPYVLELPR